MGQPKVEPPNRTRGHTYFLDEGFLGAQAQAEGIGVTWRSRVDEQCAKSERDRQDSKHRDHGYRSNERPTPPAPGDALPTPSGDGFLIRLAAGRRRQPAQPGKR